MKFSRTINMKTYLMKVKIVEMIKFDYQSLKLIFSIFFYLKYYFYKLTNNHYKAINTLSMLYRTGWAGSKKPTISIIKSIFSKNSEFKETFIQRVIESVKPLKNTQKFFSDATELFEGVMIVLKSPSTTEKGVIIIAYSYYFPLAFKLFDMEKIAERYHFVLEPSWSGLCDPDILVFTKLSDPVFVMAFEQRDADFIKGSNTNLVPLAISANWWVDYRYFLMSDENKRDIDVIVVAAWAKFKRHANIFKAIKALKDQGEKLNITLVGYPGDMTMDDIKVLANYYGINEQVTYYEWIPPQEVAKLMMRAKVNLLWSRMEGVNRAIIEGMFCNTPCILRDGFNYGQKYSYINLRTGEFSTENDLPSTILKIKNNYATYSPRAYVEEFHTCEVAVTLLNEVIAEHCYNTKDATWSNNIDLKVNELHGMKYFSSDLLIKYADDYRWIKETLK
ncbi:glycosyltransferase [Paraglaciecola sp.]|uniref:glycosyltransferase n=1 Tax=Paraglaciecola sp. TaxID=1920173 RepID=UPI00273D4EF0|nr:glycosyltransferase [Paraglaciecola sp.]MDP5030983.1 glycosyltransferase [Paraglaciecola sp.]